MCDSRLIVLSCWNGLKAIDVDCSGMQYPPHSIGLNTKDTIHHTCMLCVWKIVCLCTCLTVLCVHACKCVCVCTCVHVHVHPCVQF